MNRRIVWGAQLLLILLCALALKVYYSTASANELLWILAPTTRMVELLSGRDFTFESFSGFMSSDHTFVIAVPCAGVNFLLTAFLMLGLRSLWRARFEAVSWRFLPSSAVIAYAGTLIANTTRICIALEIQQHSIEFSWLTANQLHRLEGIVVYFGFLLLLFLVTERMEGAKTRGRLVFPLVIYYATTLGIPLLNGSFRQGSAFWEHFAFVLLVPMVLVFVGAALRGRPRCGTTSVGGDGRPRRAAPTTASLANIKRSGAPCECRSRHTLRDGAVRSCDAG